jgi:hypothetical protein
MSSRTFSLKPFPAAGPLPSTTITGEIARSSNKLVIGYALQGDPKAIVIPHPAKAPTRKDGLWKDTCLELFVTAKGSDRYWEFNLSPTAHWNVYRFDAYRQGRHQEEAFSSLPFRVWNGPDALRFALELDLDPILPPGQAVDIAVSAVLRRQNGDLTYWALSHHGPQPDFHRRDGFLIEL